MRKIEAKIIAKILAAEVCDQIDLFAFDECDDLITDSEKDQIIEAIKEETGRLLSFAKKYTDAVDYHTTRDIVDNVIYE